MIPKVTLNEEKKHASSDSAVTLTHDVVTQWDKVIQIGDEVTQSDVVKVTVMALTPADRHLMVVAERQKQMASSHVAMLTALGVFPAPVR